MEPTCEGPRRRDCACPQARHEHGTQLGYIRDGCRGFACCAANTARERARNRAKLYNRYDGLVDAEPVRQQIQLLRDHGVGLKQIVRVSGVPGGVLTRLIYGCPRADGTRRPPSLRCTPRTRDRIMAIPLDALAGGAIVESAGTRRRLQALVAIGWSQAKLARLVGAAPSNFRRTMQGTAVLASTRDAVAELYDRIWDQPPAHATRHDLIAYNRAKRHAAEHKWASPLAWDDDTIDDPAAKPLIDSPDDNGGIDEIAVERFMSGTLRDRPHATASPERGEAIRRLAVDYGMNDAGIGQRVGMTTTNVGWFRHRHGIPAGVRASGGGGVAA